MCFYGQNSAHIRNEFGFYQIFWPEMLKTKKCEGMFLYSKKKNSPNNNLSPNNLEIRTYSSNSRNWAVHNCTTQKDTKKNVYFK